MQLETATLRCSACGARCEPTRSFCGRCGSAVFVDEVAYARLRRMPNLERSGSESGAQSTLSARAQQLRRAGRRTGTSDAMQPARVVAQGAGCLGSLVRWVVFVGIAYYALTMLGLWPGVRQAADSLMNGRPLELAPVIERLRGLAGLPESSPAGDVPAEGATPLDEALIRPPRPTRQVPARYPAEAFARGLQGTVVLRVTVEPDGAVSEIEVIRSVDARYGIDDAAVAAVRQWTFEPGRRNETRAQLSTTVSVRFALPQGQAPAAPAPR